MCRLFLKACLAPTGVKWHGNFWRTPRLFYNWVSPPGVNMAKICENCRDTVDRQGKFLVHLVSQLRCFCSVLCSGKHFLITIEVILDPSQPTDGLSPWFWLMKIRYLEYQPAANNLCLFSTRVQLSEKKSKTKHKNDKTQGIMIRCDELSMACRW